MSDFAPQNARDVADIVATLVAARETIEILGNGTRRRMGRPVVASHRLTTRHLSGITLYEPEELVLSVGAGTLLSEIETLLEANGQHLAFEPPHHGAHTIGGVVAAGLSGPRRVQAGAVRDQLLGFTAVNGFGDIFKGGSRVVKNVTGYDLPKLMAGSFGTLSVLCDVTLKVLPRPKARTTLVVRGLAAKDGAALLRRVLGMPLEISGAAFVPEFDGTSVTAMRLEGFAEFVADRAQDLARATGAQIAGAEFAPFWEMVRDVTLLKDAAALWRVCVPPVAGADFLNLLPEVRGFMDWGGGLVWLGVEDSGDCGAAILRAAVAKTGGHATLVRASEATRATLDVFQSQPKTLAALTRRVKESFDPLRIFNPGRMYAGL